MQATESKAANVRHHNLPRAVRPAWVTIGGDVRDVATGPQGRAGRLEISVAIRQDGGIVDDYATLFAVPSPDGKTTTVTVSVLGEVVHRAVVTQ